MKSQNKSMLVSTINAFARTGKRAHIGVCKNPELPWEDMKVYKLMVGYDQTLRDEPRFFAVFLQTEDRWVVLEVDQYDRSLEPIGAVRHTDWTQDIAACKRLVCVPLV